VSSDESLVSYDRLTALRIVDVNLNRASEGLRVVEEYCRFALADSQLTARCKTLRDQLHAAMEPLSRVQLLGSRDTSTDVGATPEFAGTIGRESGIASLEQIAIKNGERVKEALRAIEEFCKPLGGGVAVAISLLRYQWYNLERDCELRSGGDTLAKARLYVLVSGGNSECEFVERVQSLITAGVHVIQLRDKSLDDRELLARARLLRRIIDESPTRPLFIVNDRPDIAVLARADGVHLGQDDMSVADARRIAGQQMLIGISTHSIEQARQAVSDGANYIGCGPTFRSETKQFEHFPGIEFLRRVAVEVSLPAFAIGGITLENLPRVLTTGFSRVAVAGSITSAEEPAAAARLFLAALGCNTKDET